MAAWASASVKPCETDRAFGGHPRHPFFTEDETLDIGDSLPPYASEVTVKGLTFCLRVCNCSCYKDLCFFFWPGKQKAWCRGNRRSCFSALLLFFCVFHFCCTLLLKDLVEKPFGHFAWDLGSDQAEASPSGVHWGWVLVRLVEHQKPSLLTVPGM